MADIKYTDSTPVDEPVAKPKQKAKSAPKSTPKAESADMGMGYAKGGSASSRADGIAQRGKTRGTMVMCSGGMAKK